MNSMDCEIGSHLIVTFHSCNMFTVKFAVSLFIACLMKTQDVLYSLKPQSNNTTYSTKCTIRIGSQQLEIMWGSIRLFNEINTQKITEVESNAVGAR